MSCNANFVRTVSLIAAILGGALGYNAFFNDRGGKPDVEISESDRASVIVEQGEVVDTAQLAERSQKASDQRKVEPVDEKTEPVTKKAKPVAKHGISITPSAKDTPTSICIMPEKVDRKPCVFSKFHDGEWVTGWGVVKRVLPDDTVPPCHQRFILVDSKGNTMLVANNIDRWQRLADVKFGDVIEFKGEFKIGDNGYVIHWTHPDTSGRRPGGYVRKAR